MRNNHQLPWNTLLIAALTAIFVSIVFLLNGINGNISRQYQSTLDRLSSKDSNLTLLQSAKDEMMLADNQYRYYLYTHDSVARKNFVENVNSTVNTLASIKYFDSNYISGINIDLSRKLAVSNSLLLLKTMADSLLFKALGADSSFTGDADSIAEMMISRQLQRYSEHGVDTVFITSQKNRRNIFNRIGSLFSGKKTSASKTTSSYRKGNTDSSSTTQQQQSGSNGHKPTDGGSAKYYQDILTRQAQLRKDAAAKEKQYALINLSLIANINDGISILLEDFQAVEQQVKKEARVKLDTLSRQKNNLLYGSSIAILAVLGLLIRSMLRQHRFQKELVVAREKSDNLAILKTRVLSTVTHEIRAPLNAILAFGEQVGPQPDQQLAGEFVKAVSSSTEQMLTMVNDILDYSKLESGTVQIHKTPFLLRPLLDDITTSITALSVKKKLTFTLKTTIDASVSLCGNDTYLRQILYNLTGNAIKFTNNGFVELAVAKEDHKDEIQLNITVKDSGIGIAPEQQDAVFDAFVQGSGTGTASTGRFMRGAGLGLYITKKLVDLHKGSIRLESAPGEGTTFHVTLIFPRDCGPATTALSNNPEHYSTSQA